MPLSPEMKRLAQRWASTGWPKRLEWVSINRARGWSGQRVEFRFPITALVGENGSGKSTVLQAAAAVYENTDGKGKFASDFFPETDWDKLKQVQIGYGVVEGEGRPDEGLVHRPGKRWRGNKRRPKRHVTYIDLSRVQPVGVRLGYTRLVKSEHHEISARSMDRSALSRFSQIMGRHFDGARLALTNADAKREVPVLGHQGVQYSGYHAGAGETTLLEFLQKEMPKTGLVVIDEIETSLHPRAQRRLMRDLATLCRERDIQVILSTHSQVILEELPPEARAYILINPSGREILHGVSPEFAMTKMDEVPRHECDVYVEDERAATMLREMLVVHDKALVEKCQIIPYGASSVGRALGQMVYNKKFPRASCVFLDGDEDPAGGCTLLPGDAAPERVVFEALRASGWAGLAGRTGRPHSDIVDYCERAMTTDDEHQWVRLAASELKCGGDVLWHLMCNEWAVHLPKEEAEPAIAAIYGSMPGTGVDLRATFTTPPPPPELPPIQPPPDAPTPRPRRRPASPNEPSLPFGQSPADEPTKE